MNWQNGEGTFGVMVQAFYEERQLRRDGVELLGYDTIAAGSAVATANPDLAGVAYPRMIGAALFEQERKRVGGLIDLEFRPTDELSIDLQYFMSDLEATNYNRNYLVWATHFINSGVGQRRCPVTSSGTAP
jgi:iron complex outermembrane receptor protein